MIKFVLVGYRNQTYPDILLHYPSGRFSYPVYEAQVISENLIFGREP